MSSKWTVDPEELIPQVEGRPLLYSRSMPDYKDINMKSNAWKDIAKALSPDWDSLGKSERTNRYRIVQNKWKHLRDSFRREHYGPHTYTSRSKRKKYRYYDQLKFLIPNVKSVESYKSSVPDDDVVFLELQQDSTEFDEPLAATSNIFDTPTKKTLEVLKPIDGDSGSCADEDRAFCLSLVQSLRRMDYDSKMLAKIEILRVIHNHSHKT